MKVCYNCLYFSIVIVIMTHVSKFVVIGSVLLLNWQYLLPGFTQWYKN